MAGQNGQEPVRAPVGFQQVKRPVNFRLVVIHNEIELESSCPPGNTHLADEAQGEIFPRTAAGQETDGRWRLASGWHGLSRFILLRWYLGCHHVPPYVFGDTTSGSGCHFPFGNDT
jgi:hypothetical protein